jgi:hypothetical protein
MDEDFENFNDQDEEWLTELEIRAADLENELFDWREAHTRELTETSYGRDGAPGKTRDTRNGALRAQPRQPPPRQAPPRGARPGEALHHVIEDEDLEQNDELTTIIRPRARTGARPGWPQSGRGGPSAGERTQALIDRGRRSTGRARKSRFRKIVLGGAGLTYALQNLNTVQAARLRRAVKPRRPL